jgi:hypothetical protein
MADNNPWAGISSLGALDQKLYQSTKTDPTPPSPLEKKQKVAPIEKRDVTHKTETVQTVIEQEIRMTLPLPESSVALLELIERTIFMKRDIKYRSKQRITKNNVARNWIGLLKEVEIDWANIKDDADLTKRLRKALT